MPDLTRGKTYGLIVMVVFMGTLSGCGFLSGSGCGPGAEKIGNLDGNATQSVSVTGSVTMTGPGSFMINDGSGKAFVMSGQADVSEGDCVTVEGIPTSTFTNQRADVAIAPTNLTTS